jgi:hypothetical protein
VIHGTAGRPVRKIVGEELIRPTGQELAELFEVLDCGHRQPVRVDEDGDWTDGYHKVQSRRCKGCRDGLPAGPPGEVLDPVTMGVIPHGSGTVSR